jgi:hypothetical protein
MNLSRRKFLVGLGAFGIDDPQARPRVRHDFVISTTETSVPCGFIAQRWRSA